MTRNKNNVSIAGWKEWVTLPGLCPVPLQAKVDTGALSSTLHASSLEIDETTDSPVATFEVHPIQRSIDSAFLAQVPVVDFREVRSSSGHSELRPVIRTDVAVGDKQFEIDVTLTSRENLEFRMLLGRAALRGRFLIDPEGSYCQGEPE